MQRSLALCASITTCAVLLATARGHVLESQPADLFTDCRDADVLPATLKKTYTEFTVAAPEGTVEKFCLPYAVPITTEVQAGTVAYPGIHLAFLKSGFSAAAVSASKESEDCYLIRTTTTALHFVQTRTGNWRIYAYADKPIL